MGTTETKPSTILKRLFRKAKKANAKLTLKTFVRKLADEGETLAKTWLFNKSLQADNEAKAARLVNKGGRIAMEKAATKLSRRRKSQGKSAKTTTTAAAAPAK